MEKDDVEQAKEWYGDVPEGKLKKLVTDGNDLAQIELDRRRGNIGQTRNIQERTLAGLRVTTPGGVVVVDIKMPFWSMVAFMVKWTIASIPALIILWLIVILIAAVLGGSLGALLLK